MLQQYELPLEDMAFVLMPYEARQLPESQVNIETGLPLIPVRDEITGMTVYFGLGSRSTGSDYEKVRRTDRELKKRYPNPFERARRHLD